MMNIVCGLYAAGVFFVLVGYWGNCAISRFKIVHDDSGKKPQQWFIWRAYGSLDFVFQLLIFLRNVSFYANNSFLNAQHTCTFHFMDSLLILAGIEQFEYRC